MVHDCSSGRGFSPILFVSPEAQGKMCSKSVHISTARLRRPGVSMALKCRLIALRFTWSSMFNVSMISSSSSVGSFWRNIVVLSVLQCNRTIRALMLA